MEISPARKKRKLRSYPVFSIIPDEIMLQIFWHLDVISQYHLRRVSQKWNSLLRQECITDSIKIIDSRKRGALSLEIVHNLHRIGAFERVKHIVIQGEYDPEIHEFMHVMDMPRFGVFESLMEHFVKMKKKDSNEFSRLETISVRNVVIFLEIFRDLVEDAALRCSLIISDSSLIMISLQDFLIYYIPFPVHGSRSFQLSGEIGNLKDGPVVTYGKPKGLNWNPRNFPVEIIEYLAETCAGIPHETLAGLGSTYAVLLKGARGMAVRGEVCHLFYAAFGGGQAGIFDRTKRHWEQCSHYDFSRATALQKQALVHYCDPRTCYRKRRTLETDEDAITEI